MTYTSASAYTDAAGSPPGQSSSTFSPDEELALFGAPPLLKGEDPNKYSQLLETVSRTVEPADIFERTFVRTVVDLIWEVNRYRRLIADVLVAAEQQGLERVLKILVDGTETLTVFEGYLVSKSQELAQQYKLQQEAAIQEVDALLASAGLDWEAVKAAAFSLRVREIEALNRMISSAENRMKTTLREIDRHRKGFGQELRRAIEQLDDPTTELSKEQEKLKRAA